MTEPAMENTGVLERVRFAPSGDAAVLVSFADRLDPQASAAALALDEALRWDPFDGFIEAAPSFSALLVRFDPLVLGVEEATAEIRALLEAGSDADAPAAGAGRLWRVPATYGGAAGLDLPEVAARAGLSEEAAIGLHVGAPHSVYMLGFLPGAPYLGGLPAALDAPRLAEPRLRVPAGSIAIAGGLSVIYPVASPGGWRVIGQTPAPLFDPTADPPALLSPGDVVRFEPVSPDAASRLAERAASGEWRPSPEGEAQA